tara:strand:+ start:128 stop:814 length:687 start_codon:yes stop_codon:yes gene_type:complete
MDNYKILIAEDEADILEVLQYNLEKEGYNVITADNGKKALQLAIKHQPDLILLDIMMPEMDGVEVCREIRAADLEKQAIIAFLTARNEDYSQIAGFEAGGDDYIAKPIRPKVLISRIKALLKRRHIGNSIKEENPNIVFGEFELLKDEYIIKKGNEDISLAKKEFELVKLLASRPGKVFTREEIYNKIWGSDIIIGDRTIDVHIRKLREKLDENIISTIKGVGYKLNA